MQAPIILLSSERSGSNLNRVIFDSHKNICGPTTPHLSTVFMPLLPYYGDLSEDANFSKMAEHLASVIENHVGNWKINPTADELMSAAQDRSYAALAAAAYDLEAEANGKRRVIIKDNGNIDFAFELAAMYPEAVFLYNVRDPRDAAASLISTPGFATSVSEFMHTWVEEQEKALRLYTLFAPAGRIYLSYYEDITSDPETCLPKICEWLGEEFDPNMLEFHKSKQSQDSAATATAWKNLSVPLMKKNFGKWRDKLSSRQARTVERIAGREMVALGYPPEMGVAPGKRTLGETIRAYTKAGRSAFEHYLNGKEGRAEVARRVPRFQNVARVRSEVNSTPSQVGMPSVFSDDT